MKKGLLLIFTLIMFFQFQTTHAALLKINPDEITLSNIEELITISVEIENVEDLAGFQFDIEFDPEVLTIVNIDDIKILQGENILECNSRISSMLGPDIKNIEKGIITLGAYSYGSESGANVYTETKALAETQFKVKSKRTSEIKLNNVLLSDTSANSLIVNEINGSKINVTPDSGDSGGGGICFLSILAPNKYNNLLLYSVVVMLLIISTFIIVKKVIANCKFGTKARFLDVCNK